MKSDCATRQRILAAALRHFAEKGYAGTSVADIVEEAKVAKPALYYYFKSKAGLYQALIDNALDERYRLMREAAERGKELRSSLVEIMSALFEFLVENRELMRLTFATAFASPGQVPASLDYVAKRTRNFEFTHSLMKQGIASGILSRKFKSDDLAFGFHGMMNIYIMTHLVLPGQKLNRKTAEKVVELFMSGAAISPGIKPGVSARLN